MAVALFRVEGPTHLKKSF